MTYHLHDRFGSLLWGRAMAVALRDTMLHDRPSEAVLDFTGVTMVTRAFMDELRKIEVLLQENTIALRILQPAPEPVTMLWGRLHAA